MKHRKQSAHGLRAQKNRPLFSDEVVALESARPSVRGAFESVKKRRRPLIVSSLESSRAPIDIRPSRAHPNAFTLESASQLVVGMLGKTGDRLPRKAAPKKTAAATPAKRPRNLAHSYLPRVVPREERRLLRSVSGGLIRPENVYGNDDRVTFWPSDYPWQCTGKLFSWTKPGNPYSMMSGSAVLVGPRHVLTCGHMCPWYSDPWQMLFVPGYFDGTSTVGIDSYVSDYRGWDTGMEVEGNDIALLRLYDPLGDELGWFGSKQYESRWQDQPVWGLIGWPGAIANAQRPTFQGGISVLRSDVYKNNFLEIMHRGDSSDGNSGGPLYSFWDDGYPYVIGAHSGADLTNNKDFNAAAGGRAMVDLIRWGLANWP